MDLRNIFVIFSFLALFTINFGLDSYKLILKEYQNEIVKRLELELLSELRKKVICIDRPS